MSTPPLIYYVLQIVVPAIIIIAGWFVVYNNSKKIESRKEARDFVDQIDSLVDEIYTECVEYYSSIDEKHIGNKSSGIKSKFLLLSYYLLILKGLGIKFKGSRILGEFRRNVTGSFFETVDFHKQSQIPGWCEETANSAAQLKLSVRQAYFEWCGSYRSANVSARKIANR